MCKLIGSPVSLALVVVAACTDVVTTDELTPEDPTIIFDADASSSVISYNEEPPTLDNLDQQVDAAGSSAVWAAPQVACLGTTNPFAVGPRCCPRTTVLRPWQQRCDTFVNLSPLRDNFGAYIGAADRPNLLPISADTLQVCAAYIADNGEGTDWPHGPYGNLYVDIFAGNEPLAVSADGANRRRIGQERQLRGPHRTHGTTDEWNDDEWQRYQGAGIYQWAGRTDVVLRIWESDGSEDGSWGRRNDVLGLEQIMRSRTSSGLWVALHKYTNDHPRRRTATITGWLLVQTGGVCPH